MVLYFLRWGGNVKKNIEYVWEKVVTYATGMVKTHAL